MNVRADFSHYVLKVPHDIKKASLAEIITEGELIAYKDGASPYFTKDGVRAKQWLIYMKMPYRNSRMIAPMNDAVVNDYHSILNEKRDKMGCFKKLMSYYTIRPLKLQNR